jgi:hypothetical protein
VAQVSKNPEKELEEFLASKPAWMQRFFQTRFGSLSPDDIQEWCNNFDEVCRAKDEYERILQLIPAKWKAYRKRLKQEAQGFSQLLVPKGQAGRKRNEELAERIWQLDADGKSNLEIHCVLRAEGINLSLEGVESYLKSRRKVHTG